MTIQEVIAIKVDTKQLNEKLPGLIREYKAEQDEYVRSLLFQKILEYCAQIINYCVNKIKFQPPMTREEIVMQAQEYLFYCIASAYDESKIGNKLSNYLISYMINNLISYMKYNQNTIAIPGNSPKTYKKIEKDYEECNYDYNALVEKGHSSLEIQHFLNYSKTKNCITDSSLIVDDFIPSKSNLCGAFDDSITMNGYSVSDVFDVMETYLTSNERFILIKILIEGYSNRKVGQELGITKQRVNQIYHNALTKLKNIMYTENE